VCSAVGSSEWRQEQEQEEQARALQHVSECASEEGVSPSHGDT
jgi:hypothetical protein